MRLWSIHPEYLDTKGLLAVWREALLAKKVLEGETNGYKNHSQLLRFKNTKDPLLTINEYLKHVYFEALNRGYNFNKDNIDFNIQIKTNIFVTKGQLLYEWNHLLNKLKIRDYARYKKLSKEKNIKAHPLFTVIEGNIEHWEKVNTH